MEAEIVQTLKDGVVKKHNQALGGWDASRVNRKTPWKAK